ncbi:MAG: transposase [Candidatus Competibacteraceae bacterium]
METELIKSRKIRLYPTTEQRQIFKRWLGVSRLVYNRTVEYLKEPGTTANWMAIKKPILDSLPEFCKEAPFQIKSIAIFDACLAVQNAKKKFKQTGEFQEVSFRSRKAPEQSLFIPAAAVKVDGIYPRLSGKGLRYAEDLPSAPRDSRLILRNGKWYLAVAYLSTTVLAENQGRVVALDPGIRSFITFFAEDSCGHLGKGDFGRIQRLCIYLDDLISRRTQEKDRKRRQRMKKAEGRLRDRIRHLIDELHHKVARFLVDHFDVILLPTFESKKMALKAGRKIRKKSVRNLLTFAHYRFKQFLKHKAFETGKCVLDVCEAYTSKTLSWTGEIIANLGGRKIIRANGIEIDRDLSGARGIFLRALVDSPAIIHILGNACIVNDG